MLENKKKKKEKNPHFLSAQASGPADLLFLPLLAQQPKPAAAGRVPGLPSSFLGQGSRPSKLARKHDSPQCIVPFPR